MILRIRFILIFIILKPKYLNVFNIIIYYLFYIVYIILKINQALLCFLLLTLIQYKLALGPGISLLSICKVFFRSLTLILFLFDNFLLIMLKGERVFPIFFVLILFAF